MKAKLVINLIEAHSEKNEEIFKKAVEILAADEEKKGNLSIASLLRSAYKSNKKKVQSYDDKQLREESFLSQGLISMPKDKDSALELLEIQNPSIQLNDVALPEKALNVLEQVIEEQRSFEKLLANEILPSNRLLFCGPPGCGKTLTANALAGELKIPIAYVKLDGLVSSYLGETGTNIRKIFDFVKNKRIILFLDEFDAIAKKRDDSNELGELKRVVTTLLQNMDLMPPNVILIAATNHHHLLDPAIWRRFDISILLELPNLEQRKKIIENFIKNKLSSYQVDLKVLMTLTDGMSGAEIQSFLQSLIKYCLLKKEDNTIDSKEIIKIWLQQKVLFISESSDEYINELLKLKKNGIPLRTLEEITGIPKSTLDYKFKKEGGSNEKEN
ncbi:AAA family ATPase [Cetobacterium sp.]|uniref:AAA family ATPase n=1 Tax=Cetobacterium sp. TaxID=2071632 RepID=UPI003EE566FD